jgi:hypothetical protein
VHTNFVRKFIGDDDLALRIFCPLVQVAFETNRPTQAFAILLGAFKYNLSKGKLDILVNQPEPCRWIEVFDIYMDKTRFDPPEYGDLLSKKFFRLDRYGTSIFRIGGRVGHPIIGHFAKLWGELEKRDIAFRYAFTAPNGYRRQIEEIKGIFNQPIAFLKFSIGGENIILMVGDLDLTGIANLSGVSLDAAAIKSAIVGYLAIYGVVRRFGSALMDPDFRLCHHVACPLYEANFCNMWFLVPARFADCGFEKNIEQAFAVADKAHSPVETIMIPAVGTTALEGGLDGTKP